MIAGGKVPSHRLTFFCFLAYILFVFFFTASYASDASRIAQRVAAATTVRILTPGPDGSAVVLKNDKGCVIGTAWHVVNSIKHGETGEIEFIGAKRISFSENDVMQITGKDLALIQLSENCPVQQVAILGLVNDISIGDQVFVSGFSSNSSPEVISPSFRVVSGFIESLTPQADGYSLTYTANTQSGMSGGGVFNDRGRLIGIHGRGETLGQSGLKVAAMGILSKDLMANVSPSGGNDRARDYQNYSIRADSLRCPGVVC